MDYKKQCDTCGAELGKYEIALSLKLLGTATTERYCKKCMAKKMCCTEERLDELIEYFKKTKCSLFS